MEGRTEGGREAGECCMKKDIAYSLIFLYFSSCCDKTQDESNLKEKGVIRYSPFWQRT